MEFVNSGKSKSDLSSTDSKKLEIIKGEEDIDRGWAWVIFFAGFMNFFLCAILYTSGVFNVMFLEEYQQSKAVTSWTGALAIGLFSLMAPLGSISNNYVGPRITIIIGGLLTSLGYCLTYFATSITHVIITFGVMQGTGFCIMYYSSLVSLGFYFRRYRNLAYGFALTGIGFGIMIFPLLLDYLIETYGKRGTLLIIGAIQTHSFVVGALTRPFNMKSLYNKDSKALSSSRSDILEHQHQKEHYTLECVIESGDSQNLHNDDVENFDDPSSEKFRSDFDFEKNNSSYEKESIVEKKTSQLFEENKQAGRNKITMTMHSKLRTLSECAQDMLVLPFITYCINLFLNGIGLYSMYVHFPAYAKSIGISSQFTSILLTIMGAGSLVCRIIIGITTNGSSSRTLIAYIGSGLITGIVCLVGPYLCINKIGQIIFSILFSFFGNIYIALMSPVVIDLMGLERSVTTTGIALFMIGIGAVGGPPLLGLLADLTDTYYYIFPFNGLCFLVGGLVMLIPPLQKQIKKISSCRDKSVNQN